MAAKTLEEIIIGKKNEYKNGVYGDIRDCIYIKEIPYRFAYESIFDGKAKVLLPIVFKDMDEDTKRGKYISLNRPQIIKTNEEDVNLCFSLTDVQIKKEEIDDMAENIKSSFLKMHTAERFLEEDSIDNGKNYISWFTYYKATMAGYFYTHMFLTSVDEKMAIGMFNCPRPIGHLWKDVMKEIMVSFIETKKMGE